MILPDPTRAYALFGIAPVNVAVLAWPAMTGYYGGGLETDTAKGAFFLVNALFPPQGLRRCSHSCSAPVLPTRSGPPNGAASPLPANIGAVFSACSSSAFCKSPCCFRAIDRSSMRSWDRSCCAGGDGGGDTRKPTELRTASRGVGSRAILLATARCLIFYDECRNPQTRPLRLHLPTAMQGAAFGRRIGKPVKLRHCPRNGIGAAEGRGKDH